jgi:ABC-type transport system involved in cytochrome bd biosynthesis fused ATPase/permease subunit
VSQVSFPVMPMTAIHRDMQSAIFGKILPDFTDIKCVYMRLLYPLRSFIIPSIVIIIVIVMMIMR